MSYKKHVGHHVHDGFLHLNNSKLFIGLLMIIMNIGSKYITVKLSDNQEAYLRNNIAREVIIFCACWLGTRDIYMSIIITASFFILTEHLFNENSSICLLHDSFRKKKVPEPKITREQIKESIDTLKRAVDQLN